MAAKSQTSITEGTSLDRVWASQTSKVLVLAPPWTVGIAVAVIGALFHALWGRPGTAPWAVIGETICTMLLAALTWIISHSRTALFRAHTTATALAGGAWVTAATITGVTAAATLYFLILGGVFIALTWNIRAVIRNVTGDSNGDPLNDLFARVRERFGYGGAELHTKKAGEHKIEATLALPSGEKTVEDAQKRIRNAEGAMHLPPGSITMVDDEDRADRAKVTIVDPRKMKTPIGWPGEPSRPGASIAEPLRPGLWADFDPVEYVIVGHHIQLMGQTGSAKSFGGGWNILGEAITRHDVAIFAADLTKGEQTLGPLRPAMHRFETTKAGVRAMLADLQTRVKDRTDYLAAKGLTTWESGCGLAYWLIWLEELPDIGDALGDKGMEQFLKMVKALRSAGGTIVMSLQRSDWTQMPTIARGQLANWCFGVANEKDAAFGLSPAQLKGGASPELWSNKQPGMCYIDAPGIPEDRVILPARMFLWTPRQMAEHAKAWPASVKDVDEFTAAVTAGGGTTGTAPAEGQDEDDDEGIGDVIGEYQRVDDPTPQITATIDDDMPDDPAEDAFTFTRDEAAKMRPEEARGVLLAQLEQWAREGREAFAVRDLREVLHRTGMKRQWAHKQILLLLDDDVIERDAERQRYMLKMPALA